MRTTIILDPDVAPQLAWLTRERSMTFKKAVNSTPRAGLAVHRARQPTRHRPAQGGSAGCRARGRGDGVDAWSNVPVFGRISTHPGILHSPLTPVSSGIRLRQLRAGRVLTVTTGAG